MFPFSAFTSPLEISFCLPPGLFSGESSGYDSAKIHVNTEEDTEVFPCGYQIGNAQYPHFAKHKIKKEGRKKMKEHAIGRTLSFLDYL